ncbi:peptidase [Salipaludibacillus aurantiacus]|uniref:Probable succinyl-diaminopimelate desuccinylase n=1 Tax=Salipaludibacillus aurantiacus TaxID=1601833 RepID=A0A1H9P1U4_9BACI|nr:peptidase [Salipaludibacillus aurantiacus]SER41553.1 acetylornithine deacetylase [Salipaludibacillus aurantiacus]
MIKKPAATHKAIRQWMADHEKQLLSMLQQMIQEPSVQMNESGIQHKTARWLEDLDFTVDMWEPGGDELFNHHAFLSRREHFKGSPNVVGVRKGEGKGKSILLNGHIDVVPEGDLSDWAEDPYAGLVKDGKIYGRGATDMKGGNAAMLFALQAISSLEIPIKGDVIFHSVIEEESGGVGTLAAILRGYTADAALIPEPTNMKIFPKQQGSMWFRLKVKGKSAHGGTSYEGINAILKALEVIQALERLEKVRNDRVTDPLFAKAPIPLPINVGVIEGGEWPSSVPDLVKVEGRVGISPEETVQEAQEEFTRAIRAMEAEDKWFKDHPVEIEWFGARWLPGSIDVNHPFMEILTEQYKGITGKSPEVEAAPWGTDGGIITAVGSTPSVVFGPGITRMAHQANEYIEIEKVRQCAEVIASTIIEWCNVEERKGRSHT